MFVCLFVFVNGHSAVSCDFDLFIRRGQFFFFYSAIVSPFPYFSVLIGIFSAWLAVVFLFAT